MTAVPVPIEACPVCQERVALTAFLDDAAAPGRGADPDFWGEPGERTLAHPLAGAWCHFRVRVNDQIENRLAYLIPLANKGRV